MQLSALMQNTLAGSKPVQLRQQCAPRLPSRSTRLQCAAVARPQQQAASPAPQQQAAPSSAGVVSSLMLSASAVATPFLLDVQNAAASGGQYGILEGRTAALLHPAMNFFLLGASLYAAYLGWAWRRARELGEEIRTLRSAQPAGTPDAPAPPNPEIEQKEQQRKDLLAMGPRDKHSMWGSLLLAAGTGIAIEGCANTYMRTGKLFPGPHLYVGGTIVALWAFAAALVPQMQKGNNLARNAHIAANTINVGLFLWQVPTGLQIVDKVFQFTKWP